MSINGDEYYCVVCSESVKTVCIEGGQLVCRTSCRLHDVKPFCKDWNKTISFLKEVFHSDYGMKADAVRIENYGQGIRNILECARGLDASEPVEELVNSDYDLIQDAIAFLENAKDGYRALLAGRYDEWMSKCVDASYCLYALESFLKSTDSVNSIFTIADSIRKVLEEVCTRNSLVEFAVSNEDNIETAISFFDELGKIGRSEYDNLPLTLGI